MGIGDMLGVKTIKITTSQPYSLEEFYERIKDVAFEAGKPEYVKNGFAYIIAFPELDRNNQVQITGSKGKFYVMRSTQPAGLTKMISNMALDDVTDGLTSLSAAFGGTKKRCLELTQNAADVITAMHL